MDVIETFIDLSVLGKIITVSVILLIILVIVLIVMLIKNRPKKTKTVPIKTEVKKEEEFKDLDEVVHALVPKPIPRAARPHDSDIYTYDIVESIEERNTIEDPNDTILDNAREKIEVEEYTVQKPSILEIDDHTNEIMEDDSLTEFEKTQELQAIISYEQLLERKRQSEAKPVEEDPIKEEVTRKIDIIEEQSNIRPLHVEKSTYKKEEETEEIRRPKYRGGDVNPNQFLEDLKNFRKTLK